MRVFRVGALSFAAACLMGCLPLTTYYKEGERVSRIDSDLVNCRVFAFEQVPKDIRRRYIRPVYKHRKRCNAQGKCVTRRVLVRHGRWEHYDANVRLRGDVQQQCMINKGYAQVKVNACSPQVIEDTKISATTVLPALTPGSCAIRLTSGRYQIVTP